jgi:hypothetical protein
MQFTRFLRNPKVPLRRDDIKDGRGGKSIAATNGAEVDATVRYGIYSAAMMGCRSALGAANLAVGETKTRVTSILAA